jgi:small conductance mechanosensitive channel
MEWIVGNILNILYAGGILIIGFLVAGWVRRVIVDKARNHEQLDDTLFTFLGSLARYGLIAVTIIIVLARFGIETTSFIAVLGAAGLAIGLALQGTLSNVAAGVMLMVFRPFKLGQFIDVAGHSGTVKEITLFTTELATGDNVQIIIPNSAIWSGSIVNYSHHDTRRVDMVFGVSYGSDLKMAETVLKSLIDDELRVHHDPAPFCKVTALGDSSVDFTLRLWCDAGDYWAIKHDMTRAAKDALEAAGVDIPFPTTRVLKA